MKNFVEIRDIASLDLLLAESQECPVVIFKHSDSCGVSTRAYAQMAGINCRIGIVTVQSSRVVSAEIEQRLGVTHETPQVLIVKAGRVVWSASHGQVRTEVVTTALASVSRL